MCNLIYNGRVFLYTMILVHNEGWYVPIAIFVIDPNRLFRTQIGTNGMDPTISTPLYIKKFFEFNQ